MVDDAVINDDDDVTIGDDDVTIGDDDVTIGDDDVTIGEVVTTGDTVRDVGGVPGILRIASGSHIRPAITKEGHLSDVDQIRIIS